VPHRADVVARRVVNIVGDIVGEAPGGADDDDDDDAIVVRETIGTQGFLRRTRGAAVRGERQKKLYEGGARDGGWSG